MYRQLGYIDYSISADPSYPQTLLREGIKSSGVARMQTYLNAIAEKYCPQITKLSVDGIFGCKTKKAVSEFQALSALDEDGIIGFQTWNRIVVDYNSIAGGGEYIWPGVILRPGFKGSDVKYMQSKLNTIGKLYTAIGQIAVDGIYGKSTADNVRLFQKQFGLTADGLAGRLTWERIYQVYLSVINMQYSDVSPQYAGIALRLGSSGDSVRFVQSYLNRLRIVCETEWPMLNIDGFFGDLTYSAVTAFQAKHNLSVDGVIDHDTWDEIKFRFNSSF